MNQELKLITEVYIGMLDEGKFIETHEGEDAHGIPKPNPSHAALYQA